MDIFEHFEKGEVAAEDECELCALWDGEECVDGHAPTGCCSHFEDAEDEGEAKAIVPVKSMADLLSEVEEPMSEDRAEAKRILDEEGIGAAMKAVLTGKHKKRKAKMKPRAEIDPTLLDEEPDEIARDLIFKNAKIQASIVCERCGRTVLINGVDADNMVDHMETLYRALLAECGPGEKWGQHPYREDGKLYCPNCISNMEKSYGLTDAEPRPVQTIKVHEVYERTVVLEEADPATALERFILGEQYDYQTGPPVLVSVSHIDGFCGVTEVGGIKADKFYSEFDYGMLKDCLAVCGMYDDELDVEVEEDVYHFPAECPTCSFWSDEYTTCSKTQDEFDEMGDVHKCTMFKEKEDEETKLLLKAIEDKNPAPFNECDCGGDCGDSCDCEKESDA